MEEIQLYKDKDCTQPIVPTTGVSVCKDILAIFVQDVTCIVEAVNLFLDGNSKNGSVSFTDILNQTSYDENLYLIPLQISITYDDGLNDGIYTSAYLQYCYYDDSFLLNTSYIDRTHSYTTKCQILINRSDLNITCFLDKEQLSYAGEVPLEAFN